MRRMMFTFIQIWKREVLYALENCSSEREIKWKGGWWAATVLKRSENRCRWPFFSVIPFLVVQFPIFAVKRTTASKKYCTLETSHVAEFSHGARRGSESWYHRFFTPTPNVAHSLSVIFLELGNVEDKNAADSVGKYVIISWVNLANFSVSKTS